MRSGPKLKFQNAEEVEAKVNAYFAECDPHIVEKEEIQDVYENGKFVRQDIVKRQRMTEQVPYTVTGLALALDTTRDTLLNYSDPEYWDGTIDEAIFSKILDTIKKAKEKCHSYAERHLYKGQAAGVIFSLKNNWGWVDKQEIEQKNIDVSAVLDRVETENDLAAKAKEAYDASIQQGGQPTKEQVLANDQPVQDQGQAGQPSDVPAQPSPDQTPN